MLVLHIGESTSTIIGMLKTFLERHFKDKVLLETITKWFQTIKNVQDYSIFPLKFHNNVPTFSGITG